MTYSVLFPVHGGDQPELLHDALESLASQSLAPGQVVVIEDGPISLRLQENIEAFHDKLPLERVRLAINQGLGHALNHGLAACQHELVARMDADDVCFDDRLEKQVNYLKQHPEVDILGTHAIEIDQEDILGNERATPVSHDEIFRSLWTCPFLHPTVMFRKQRIEEIGGYDANLRRRQDYALWFRAGQAGLGFANLPEPLLYYRFAANTHKKQPPSLSWQQALIGFKGSRAIGLPYWKQLACFVPFFRSLLPHRAQHALYYAMKRFDPRHSN